MAVNQTIVIPEAKGLWGVQADSEWLCVQRNGQTVRLPMDSLDHCLVSSAHLNHFIVTTKDGITIEFAFKGTSTTSEKLFWLLSHSCHGFQNISSTYTVYEWNCSIYHYRLDQNQLISEYTRRFRGGTKQFFCIPVRDIAWVTQHHVPDPDSTSDETYYLRIYTANGKFYDAEGNSIQDCYQMALRIKDNAPQLRYGAHTPFGLDGLIAASHGKPFEPLIKRIFKK